MAWQVAEHFLHPLSAQGLSYASSPLAMCSQACKRQGQPLKPMLVDQCHGILTLKVCCLCDVLLLSLYLSFFCLSSLHLTCSVLAHMFAHVLLHDHILAGTSFNNLEVCAGTTQETNSVATLQLPHKMHVGLQAMQAMPKRKLIPKLARQASF